MDLTRDRRKTHHSHRFLRLCGAWKRPSGTKLGSSRRNLALVILAV
jgi:ribosomal protein L32E